MKIYFQNISIHKALIKPGNLHLKLRYQIECMYQYYVKHFKSCEVFDSCQIKNKFLKTYMLQNIYPTSTSNLLLSPHINPIQHFICVCIILKCLMVCSLYKLTPGAWFYHYVAHLLLEFGCYLLFGRVIVSPTIPHHNFHDRY